MDLIQPAEATVQAKISDLYHYPVKGLSSQALDQVQLEKGQGFPFDRVYGIARYNSGYNPAAYKPLPKTHFIVLVGEERLSELKTHFDPSTHVLQIYTGGREVFKDTLNTADGRNQLVLFFADMFNLHGEQQPMVAVGGKKRFTDISVHSEAMMNGISIINLNSIKDLESRAGVEINPLRFRANIYVEGLPAYREFDLLDKEITIGNARLKIFRRTRRCAATDVNPDTAIRDLTIPRMLMDHLGHADMGVYAEVIEGDVVTVGSLFKETLI